METLALRSLVCVKAEPCEDVCTEDERSWVDVSVKVERLTEDVDEESVGVSAAAVAAGLYVDHIVKDELVLGPVLVERRGERRAPAAVNLAIDVKQEPLWETVYGRKFMLKDCCVRLTRLSIDMLSRTTEGLDSQSRRNIACVQRTRRNITVGDSKVNKDTSQETRSGRHNTYHCGHCKYATARRECLIKHLRTHTNEKPYGSNQCSYAIADKSNFQAQRKKHTGEKPHQCSQCSYASVRKHDLKVHERIHTGDKPYKCDQCSFTSRYKLSLQLHKMTHTGDKPYKCDQCTYATIFKANLKRHKKMHTKVHEMTHTVKKPYQPPLPVLPVLFYR